MQQKVKTNNYILLYKRVFTLIYSYLLLSTIIYSYLLLSTLIYSYIHLYTLIYSYISIGSSSVPNWDRQRFLYLLQLKILPWTSLRLVWLPYKLSSGYSKFYSLPQTLLQIHVTTCYCDIVTYRAGNGQLIIDDSSFKYWLKHWSIFL